MIPYGKSKSPGLLYPKNNEDRIFNESNLSQVHTIDIVRNKIIRNKIIR